MKSNEQTTSSKEIRLKSRPMGLPKADNFELATVPVPPPQKDEVLVRNLWMSIDPYMRPRMDDTPSYIPPFEVNRVLEGAAIGQVLESNAPNLQAGDFVTSIYGWREAFVAKASDVQKLTPILPTTVAPIETYLSVLGIVGLTAYVALFRIAQLKPGERVFISGATGGVGSTACVLAKSIGCYVVGTAGGEEKRRSLEQENGVDVAIDYRAPNLNNAVAKAFPQGIDVYLENAGGEQLRVALDHMRPFGRIAFCGIIGQYNEVTPSPGPPNLFQIITRKLRVEGFIILDHLDLMESFQRAAAELVRTGKLKWRHTVSDGIEAAPQAFINMCSGKSFGKSFVKLS